MYRKEENKLNSIHILLVMQFSVLTALNIIVLSYNVIIIQYVYISIHEYIRTPSIHKYIHIDTQYE